MKKVLLLVAMAAILSTDMFAQTTTAKQEEKALPGFKTTFEANRFWENWFISVGIGGQAMIAENMSLATFGKATTIMPTIAFGKMFNPWWGIRVQGTVGPVHGFLGDGSVKKYLYGGAHVDFMFGLIEFFAPYKENRIFDLVPFAGAGLAFFNNGGGKSITFNAGLQARFRVSPYIDINLEYQGQILDDNTVMRRGFKYDGISSLSAGITVRLGKTTGFNTGYTSAQYSAMKENFEDMQKNYNEAAKENEQNKALAAKQAQTINAQQQQIAQLEDRAEKAEAKAKEIKTLPATLTFPFNSSKIKTSQAVNIYAIAEYMKEHPEAKVRVIGYACRRGSDEANRKISKRRSDNVTNMLVEKYGIDASRIVTEFKGVRTVYGDDDWNRAAVVELVVE